MIVRRVNWTKKDARDLTDLMDKYKHIIENKITNATTNGDKQKTWERITFKFNRNLSEEQRRIAKQLKEKSEFGKAD